MPRRFNTAGPCLEGRHYMLPPLERLPEAEQLVRQGAYFAIHAPRQTGKTTLLRSLARELTASGDFAAVAFSCEAGEPFFDDPGAVERIVLSEIHISALGALPEALRPPAPWPEASPGQRLRIGLRAWAAQCPRPIVLLFDEIDALRGESLRTVLRQLRAGFADRTLLGEPELNTAQHGAAQLGVGAGPGEFPASVVLCGLRDVRDYKAASGGDPARAGIERLGTSSPFNVKLKSLRIGDFSLADITHLFAQHTADTGQAFADGAIAHTYHLTGGQPWLVNALARETVEEIGVPAEMAITVAHLEAAKERLIRARQTHLDSLSSKLHEPRVRRVLEPILAGTLVGGDSYDDDFSYVRDLGLIAMTPPARVANPIYREVIARVLAAAPEGNIDVDPRSFVQVDGRLDIRLILEEFAEFWREHGEVLPSGVAYHEVAPQLVLMAYLQRVVNGGGYIDREYGVGRGRIDLLVRWRYQELDPQTGEETGKSRLQREAFELKVWAPGRPDPLVRGLKQLDGYVARLGLETGVLALFDRREGIPPTEDRTRFEQAETPSGRAVLVLRA